MARGGRLYDLASTPSSGGVVPKRGRGDRSGSASEGMGIAYLRRPKGGDHASPQCSIYASCLWLRQGAVSLETGRTDGGGSQCAAAVRRTPLGTAKGKPVVDRVGKGITPTSMGKRQAKGVNAVMAAKLRWRLKRGFTLVELMVVIGIIAALSGILFVVFSSAREAARRQGCVSNLRQIAQAMAMYRADWNGVEASPGQDLRYWQLGLPSREDNSMFYFVEHYCKGWAVWRCPSARIPPTQLNSYVWYPGPDDPSIPASWDRCRHTFSHNTGSSRVNL